jgi:hypothetical protein
MRVQPPVSEELAAFLECGLSIVIATRDPELQADGAPAWAAKVHEDRAHLTVFVQAQAAPAMLANLEYHPEIAILFDLPSSHRACQVKGRLTASRKARASERPEITRQAEGFRTDLESIGIPKAMTAEWKPWPCVALELRVTQIFEQTPGPGTGELLA